MPISFPTAPFRALLGSLFLFGCFFLLNACSTSEPTRKPSTRTLRLTAYDSTSGQPLDSARAVNRTLGDSLHTDSAGQFVMRDVEPALYVFDISGYGYHTQRHVAALVEPQDTTLHVETTLLPKLLSLDCSRSRPYNWDVLTKQYQKDSARVRIQLIDVFARNGRVRIQPVVVNDLPTSTLFLPDNFGALGHYEISLYDGNNNRVPYTFADAPPDEGHRIYSKKDILPVVPQDAKRLESSTLIVQDSIEKGTTLYARMNYTFSSEDTLRATSATTFPDLKLDSLQVPVFDTLRTDGRVRVPDSLVVQRDTTKMRIVGIDTTVTRNGYLLYSTLRESNAASNPEAARNLLYVPDSVKVRARLDSLEAVAAADTSMPKVDTSAIEGAPSRFHIVNRTDRTRIDSLITDEHLAESLAQGLPSRGVTTDSLLSMSNVIQQAYFQPPSLSRTKIRRGLDTEPDTTLRGSLMSAPLSDSLFRMVGPDSLAASDTSTSGPQNLFLAAPPVQTLEPAIDSVSIDALPLTVGPDADSVVVDSVVAADLQNLPPRTYWHVPDSLSRWRTQVLVVDSTFFSLRARGRVDTSATLTITSLLPKRVGTRERIITQSYPQQVIRSPAGTYRDRYLQVWRKLHASNLQEHYCQIFPFPLRSQWRSTSMH